MGFSEMVSARALMGGFHFFEVFNPRGNKAPFERAQKAGVIIVCYDDMGILAWGNIIAWIEIPNDLDDLIEGYQLVCCVMLVCSVSTAHARYYSAQSKDTN